MPMSEIFTVWKMRAGVALRQRLLSEKKPFVASLRQKNRETVTDHPHLATLAFIAVA
jgi:hypothetical protein